MKKNFVVLAISCLFFATAFSQTTAKDWYDKGISLKKDQKYEDATEAFKKSVSLQPNYGLALHQLGWCYNELGKYDDAIAALLKEEKNDPADPASTNVELGYAYRNLKNYDDALTRFNKAVQLDPDYSLAYKERGNCYYSMDEYEKALADYSKNEELNPDDANPDFWYKKGWCENELGKYSDAINSLKKCVDLDDEYTDAFTELGYSNYKLGSNEDALFNYRTAMTLSKTAYRPVMGIADVYYDNIKNTDSAMVYYKKVTDLNQNNKTVYYRLGWCCNDKERYADAVDPLLKAIQLDPDYVTAKTELGYSYYKQKLYNNALDQLTSVMNKDSQDELSRYYAGFCYYMRDDQSNLKKMISELTAINTDIAKKYVETLNKYIR